MYRMLVKQLILEMARNRPADTSLWPYIQGRRDLRALGELGSFLTFGLNSIDSIERAQRGEIDSPAVYFGEVFALSANTINDIVTGPGRALAKLLFGQEAVNETPIVTQLDQKITGRQVVENIEAVMVYGPGTYFSCAWNALWGGTCR